MGDTRPCRRCTPHVVRQELGSSEGRGSVDGGRISKVIRAQRWMVFQLLKTTVPPLGPGELRRNNESKSLGEMESVIAMGALDKLARRGRNLKMSSHVLAVASVCQDRLRHSSSLPGRSPTGT